VNCLAVRDHLPEHALGVSEGRDADALERHLAWCAACRKEARELQRAAASLAFALAPAEPDPALEDRVVASVAGAGGNRRAPQRRGRLATAAVLAAFLAVAGLGWGAVMAGRAARLEDRVTVQADKAQTALEKFRRYVLDAQLSDPAADALLGTLRPVNGVAARGSALTLVAPSFDDQAIVLLTGLPSTQPRFPYDVSLRNLRGQTVHLGFVGASDVDADGGATVLRVLERDLRDFDRVLVRDGRGRVVLTGRLETETPVASPSP
jgi:putative zinc finger protein